MEAKQGGKRAGVAGGTRGWRNSWRDGLGKEHKAFLSSGGILRYERLEDASCWALRGKSLPKGRASSSQGCVRASAKGVSAALESYFNLFHMHLSRS